MRRTPAVVVALVMLLVGCGDDDVPTNPSPTTTAAVVTATPPEGTTTLPEATAATTTTTTIAPATTATDDGVTSITVAIGSAGLDVVVEGVLVEPGSRVAVKSGASVHLVFSGGVAEELHIHGYDLSLDLAPGGVEVLDFVADIPGIFEVELEGAHTLVFELEVS